MIKNIQVYKNKLYYYFYEMLKYLGIKKFFFVIVNVKLY